MSGYPGRYNPRGVPAAAARVMSRDEQVANLRRLNPNVRQTTHPREPMQHHDLGLIMPDRRQITLRMYLPPGFPAESPVVQVIDRVQHPSVDGNCFYVAHPNLGPNWRATNSIGQIMVDVVRDFSARPPKVVGGPRPPPFGGAPAQQPPPRGPPVSAGGGFPGAPGAGAARGPGPMPGMGTVPYPGPGAVMWPPRGGPSAGGPPSYDQAHGPGGGGGAGGGAGAASSTGAGGSMPPGGKTGDDTEDGFEATDLPPIPTNFPRLHGKSVDVLQVMLQVPKELEMFRDTHEEFKNTVETTANMTQEARASNMRQIRANLQQEAVIQTLRSEIRQLQAAADSAKAVLEAKLAQKDASMHRYTAEALKARVSAAAQEAYNSSEEVGEGFSAGDVPLKQFMKNYVALRELYHKRKATAELLDQFPLEVGGGRGSHK